MLGFRIELPECKRLFGAELRGERERWTVAGEQKHGFALIDQQYIEIRA